MHVKHLQMFFFVLFLEYFKVAFDSFVHVVPRYMCYNASRNLADAVSEAYFHNPRPHIPFTTPYFNGPFRSFQLCYPTDTKVKKKVSLSECPIKNQTSMHIRCMQHFLKGFHRSQYIINLRVQDKFFFKNH